jgi:hypothetical protein
MVPSKEVGARGSLTDSSGTRQVDDAAYESDVENQSGHGNDDSAPTNLEKTPKDTNVVDWDGPEDPANPINWPLAKKIAAISIVSLITMLSQVFQ